jgi:uncharacterized LabA/DUF88 family protein
LRAWTEDSRPRIAGCRPIALLIDGAYVARAETTLGRKTDWADLIRRVDGDGRLRTIRLYAPVRRAAEPDGLAALIEAALPRGIRLVTHLEPSAGDGRRMHTLPSALIAEFAIDAVEQAQHLDELVIMSGDAMARRVVDWVQRKGVRVTIIAAQKHGLIADRLRRQCDVFVDLGAVAARTERQPIRHAPTDSGQPIRCTTGGTK